MIDPDHDDELPRYRVEFTDVAQDEAEKAYLRRCNVMSPEKAYVWFHGIYEAAQKIAFMPRMYQRLETERYQGDIRRMLYGRGQGASKLIYRIVDPVDNETEGIVRILRVIPGAQEI